MPSPFDIVICLCCVVFKLYFVSMIILLITQGERVCYLSSVGFYIILN